MNIVNNIKKNITFLIILTIIILLIVLKDDFNNIILTLRNIDLKYIILAIILYFLSVGIKGFVNYLVVNDSNKISIKEAIKHHYKDKELDKKTIEKEVREIVALRNHYVHSGYYIHETKLLVTYKEENVEKEYYVEADVSWLRDRVEMLYNLVIDIIFTEILGYQEYSFRNIF